MVKATPRSSHMHLLLTLSFTLLLAVCWPQSAEGAAAYVTAVFPTLSTPPYRPHDSLETADLHLATLTVSGGPSLEAGATLPTDAPFPASMVGVATLSVTPHGGKAVIVPEPYPDPATAPLSAWDVNFNVVVPNSADKQTGCVEEGQELQSFTDSGEPLEGAILLLERGGGCNFYAKVLAATAKNVGALFIYNCPTCPATGLLRMETDSDIPVFFMQMEDGLMMRNYLLGRRAVLNGTAPGVGPVIAGVNYTQPITGTLVGTGPIVESEKTALQAIAGKLQLDAPTVESLTYQRDWKQIIDSPEIDPCMDRLVGVWCERGHVTLVFLKYMGLTGTIDPAFSQLTYLRDLGLGINRPDFEGLTGVVPDSICDLPLLQSLSVELNQLTALPACLGSRQPHFIYLEADSNSLTSIPSGLANATNLVYVQLATNSITAFPANTFSRTKNLAKIDLSINPLASFDGLDFSAGFNQMYELVLKSCALSGPIPSTLLQGAPNLQKLDLSVNQLEGSIPSDLFSAGSALLQLVLSGNKLSGVIPSTLNAHKSLSLLDVSSNAFSGQLDAGLFDGMASLETMKLTDNAFTGTLPNFVGCTSLAILEATHNSFSGGLPTAWIAPDNAMSILRLSFNKLNFNGTTDVLSQMPHLTEAYVDHNELCVDHRDNGDVGRTMFRLIGNHLTTLNVQNNKINGPWGIGFSGGFLTLQNFNLSTNGLTSLPEDFWLMEALVHVDLSANALEGHMPEDIGSLTKLSSLYLQGNPKLILPSWVHPSDSGVYTSTEELLYECLEVAAPQYPSLALKADPAALEYKSCRCKQGAYGTSPTCIPVPVLSNVLPYADGEQSTYSYTNATRPLVAPFSDAKFLPQALGLSTSWEIDLTMLRKDGGATETAKNPSVISSAISASSALQPVRILFIRLHISRKHFKLETDTISLLNSDAQSFFRISGEDLQPGGVYGSGAGSYFRGIPAGNAYLPDPTSPEYLSFYNDSLSRIEDPLLIEFRIPSNMATVSFTTATLAEKPLFMATYAWSFGCVDSLELLEADLGNQCLATLAHNYVTSRNGTYDYECLALSNLVSPILQALTRPSDINYRGCRCSTGTFGLPPHCDRVPLNATVSAHAVPVAEVKYSLEVMTTPDVLDLDGFKNVSSGMPASFTDAWYGGQRLTRGLSTGWTVDLRSLRRRAGNDSDVLDQPVMDATDIGSGDPLQPVRQISILLHVSRSYFTGAGNSLAVFEGNSTFGGERIFVVSGVDLASKCITYDAAAALDASSPYRLAVDPNYKNRYSIALASIDSPLLCHAKVQSSQASVSFSSRDADGQHFVATYTYGFTCPEMTELDGSNRCSVPGPSTGSVLAVVLSVCGILLVLSFGWVIRERYIRQKAQQRKNRMSSSSLGGANDPGAEDEDLQPDEMKKQIYMQREWELKKELLGQGLSLLAEITLVIATWVNVVLLVRSKNASLGDSYLSVTYVAVAVISLMGFLVNGMARALSLQGLMQELRDLRLAYNRTGLDAGLSVSSPTEDTIQLARLHRRLLQLQIVSIAVLFDNLPMLVLNALRLMSESSDQSSAGALRYFLQCVLGSILIGIKLDRLMNISELKKKVMELRLRIFDAKLMSRSKSRAGTVPGRNKGNSIAPYSAGSDAVSSPSKELEGPSSLGVVVETGNTSASGADHNAVEVELSDRSFAPQGQAQSDQEEL